MMLNRARHAPFIAEVRRIGAALRMISDGDITAAVAPSLPDSGVDLYYGVGGSPEGVLTAAALKALGGEILLRMWPRDEEERQRLLPEVGEAELYRVFRVAELVQGESAMFCATGISDSSLLPGVKVTGNKAITHSVLMRPQPHRALHPRGPRPGPQDDPPPQRPRRSEAIVARDSVPSRKQPRHSVPSWSGRSPNLRVRCDCRCPAALPRRRVEGVANPGQRSRGWGKLGVAAESLGRSSPETCWEPGGDSGAILRLGLRSFAQTGIPTKRQLSAEAWRLPGRELLFELGQFVRHFLVDFLADFLPDILRPFAVKTEVGPATFPFDR